MLTTKRNELEVINSFNDLMKDTKEKQRINKLVKQYSNEYFMEKLSDSDLVDTLQELSTHYQKYAYVIAMRIKDSIIDEYCTDDEYYDGTIDKNGYQIKKKKRVIDTEKVGKNFEEDLEEELNNLVVEEYFKNLNKALEVYNFNTKLEKMREVEKKRTLKNSSEEIEKIINDTLNGLFSYYKTRNISNYTIVHSFKYNKEVINYLYSKVLSSIKDNLDLDLSKSDIESMFEKECRLFLKGIDTKDYESEEEEEEESKIPMGWKFYAISEFINKLFK